MHPQTNVRKSFFSLIKTRTYSIYIYVPANYFAIIKQNHAQNLIWASTRRE